MILQWNYIELTFSAVPKILAGHVGWPGEETIGTGTICGWLGFLYRQIYILGRVDLQAFWDFHITTCCGGLLGQYKPLWNLKGVLQSKNDGRTGVSNEPTPLIRLKIKISINLGMLLIKITVMKYWARIWNLFWNILIQSEMIFK